MHECMVHLTFLVGSDGESGSFESRVASSCERDAQRASRNRAFLGYERKESVISTNDTIVL